LFITYSKKYLNNQPLLMPLSWWRLFQKRVFRSEFDIYVFIAITGSKPLLVVY